MRIASYAVLTLGVALSGCGTSTKVDFTARANAICATAVRQTRSISPPRLTGGAGDLAALTAYLAKVRPVLQSEATQLRAVRRSAGDVRHRGAVTRYLAALTQTVADYRELEAAARRGDAEGVAGAEAALRGSPVAALAASSGLRSCGAPGATVT